MADAFPVRAAFVVPWCSEVTGTASRVGGCTKDFCIISLIHRKLGQVLGCHCLGGKCAILIVVA